MNKTVINDNSGTRLDNEFILSFSGSESGSGIEDSPLITEVIVLPGNFTLSESSFPEYAQSSLTCTAGTLSGDVLTLSAFDQAVCTFVNDDVPLIADLEITKDDSSLTYTPGSSFSYIISVSNNGPDAADGAQIADDLPNWATNVSWTCTGSGGAECTTGSANSSGLGDINELIGNFPNGGQLIYTVTGTYSSNESDYL